MCAQMLIHVTVHGSGTDTAHDGGTDVEYGRGTQYMAVVQM